MKIKDLKNWSGLGIANEFSLYAITDMDGDTYLLNGNELDGIKEEYKDCYFDFFDTVSYREFVNNELVKPHEQYLVFALGYGWRRRNAYRFKNSIEDALSVDYDNEFYIEGTTRGEKSILLKEYSHDNPMGCHWLVVGLTDREYDRLSNSEFAIIEKFAKEQMKKIVTSNAKEKYKASLELED